MRKISPVNNPLFFLFIFLALSSSYLPATISSKPYFILRYPPHPPGWSVPGMFSTMRFVLSALYTYEEQKDQIAGLEVDFAEEGLYYDPSLGRNSWEYYCEPIRLGEITHANTLAGWDELKKEWQEGQGAESFARFNGSRELNHAILSKYIRVKPHIIKKVNEIKSKLFEGYVIGIHYRGTDKRIEVPRVDYNQIAAGIAYFVNYYHLENYKIFVATDEASFLTFMKSTYPNKIICYEESYRSDNGLPLHFDIQSGYSPYKKGEDAFIDCLLLAECHCLFATASHLSLCSSFFNINLPFFPVQ